MKRTGILTVVALLATMLFSSIASAHVTVFPKETVQGSYEKFTVRVPNEGDTATNKLTVIFPDNVKVSRVLSTDGWDYEFAQADDGSFKSITFTANDDGIKPNEFGEFNLSGKVSDNATSLTWKAIQTYADGKVVEWVGSPDADKPASVTQVNPKVVEPVDVVDKEQTAIALYIAIIALVGAITATTLSIRRK